MIISRFTPEDNFIDDSCSVHYWDRRLKPRLQERENNTPRRGPFMYEHRENMASTQTKPHPLAKDCADP